MIDDQNARLQRLVEVLIKSTFERVGDLKTHLVAKHLASSHGLPHDVEQDESQIQELVDSLMSATAEQLSGMIDIIGQDFAGSPFDDPCVSEIIRSFENRCHPYFTRQEVKQVQRIARLCRSYADWQRDGHRKDRMRARAETIRTLLAKGGLFLRIFAWVDAPMTGYRQLCAALEDPNGEACLCELADRLDAAAPLLPIRPVGRKKDVASEVRARWSLRLDLEATEADRVHQLKASGLSDPVARRMAYDHLLRERQPPIKLTGSNKDENMTNETTPRDQWITEIALSGAAPAEILAAMQIYRTLAGHDAASKTSQDVDTSSVCQLLKS